MKKELVAEEKRELVVRDKDFRLLPVASVTTMKKELRELEAFIKGEMKENIDYGKVRGIAKPFLFKAGAEHLLNLYGLAPKLEILDKVEDWEKGFFNYTIKCTLVHIRTGNIIAEGMGSCNNKETKYRYVWFRGEVKSKEVQDQMKSEGTGKWSKKEGRFTWLERKENPDPCSIVNTILKMGKKRGLVDATLSATRTSGIFTQDEETIQRFPDAIDVDVIEKKKEPEKKALKKSPEKKEEHPNKILPEKLSPLEKKLGELYNLVNLMPINDLEKKAKVLVTLQKTLKIPGDKKMMNYSKEDAEAMILLIKKQFPVQEKKEEPKVKPKAKPKPAKEEVLCVDCQKPIGKNTKTYAYAMKNFGEPVCYTCGQARRNK